MTGGLYECPYYKTRSAEAVTLTWERWRTPLSKWLIFHSNTVASPLQIPPLKQLESSRASTWPSLDMEERIMKRTTWIVGSMLALLLVGGLALEVSAQQPAAPAPPAQTESKPADSGSTPPAAQQQQQPSDKAQTPQVPSSNVQIESRTERTERVVERPSSFLGMDPTVALAIGAVLFIVIVVGLVAMSRRTEEVHHTHHV